MKEKLFAAKAELKIRKRQLNAAQRGYKKVVKTIEELNGRARQLEEIERHLELVQRRRSSGIAGTRKEESPQGDVSATPASALQRDASVAGEDRTAEEG